MAITVLKIDNFWNRLRVEKNVRYKELAELFGVCESTMGAYFSGQTMPKDTVIRELCDLFNVDFAKGKEEFKRANEAWSSSNHKCTKKLTVGNAESIKGKQAIEVVGTVERNVDVFSIIYGKIPYALFMKFLDIVATKQGDPLKLIYGSVTYSEFKQIADIIGGTSAD